MSTATEAKATLRVYEVRQNSNEIFEAVQDLTRVLTQRSPEPTSPMSQVRLEEIISSPSTHLIVAEDEGGIVGMILLATYHRVAGTRAWVEDAAVRSHQGRKGVASALMQEAVRIAATETEAPTLQLIVDPSNISARRLLERTGFVPFWMDTHQLDLRPLRAG